VTIVEFLRGSCAEDEEVSKELTRVQEARHRVNTSCKVEIEKTMRGEGDWHGDGRREEGLRGSGGVAVSTHRGGDESEESANADFEGCEARSTRSGRFDWHIVAGSARHVAMTHVA